MNIRRSLLSLSALLAACGSTSQDLTLAPIQCSNGYSAAQGCAPPAYTSAPSDNAEQALEENSQATTDAEEESAEATSSTEGTQSEATQPTTEATQTPIRSIPLDMMFDFWYLPDQSKAFCYDTDASFGEQIRTIDIAVAVENVYNTEPNLVYHEDLCPDVNTVTMIGTPVTEVGYTGTLQAGEGLIHSRLVEEGVNSTIMLYITADDAETSETTALAFAQALSSRVFPVTSTIIYRDNDLYAEGATEPLEQLPDNSTSDCIPEEEVCN